MSYKRFLLMIVVSTSLMFAFMYLNTYDVSHVHWSTTRFYMSLLMAATMSAVMLGFMLSMHKDAKLNMIIFVASALLFAASLVSVRSQFLVHDQSWMKAMIPHHSIAILTSERATLRDVRVKALAGRIKQTQQKEIQEMKWLIEDIKQNGEVLTETSASARAVPDLSR